MLHQNGCWHFADEFSKRILLKNLLIWPSIYWRTLLGLKWQEVSTTLGNGLAGRPSTIMMTSSNGNTFSVTGHLCGNSPVSGEFPAQRPVTRSFDIFFDLCLNKRLSKQSWGWWFETLSCPLWRHRNILQIWHEYLHFIQPTQQYDEWHIFGGVTSSLSDAYIVTCLIYWCIWKNVLPNRQHHHQVHVPPPIWKLPYPYIRPKITEHYKINQNVQFSLRATWN